MYARDAAGNTTEFEGGSYIGDEGTEERGNIFDIYTETELTGVQALFHPLTSADAYAKAVLYSYNFDANEFYLLAETETKHVGLSAGDWYNFKFDNPIAFTAGEVIYAAIFKEYTAQNDSLIIANNGISRVGETIIHDIDEYRATR